MAAVGKALRVLHSAKAPATVGLLDDLLTEDVNSWDCLLPEQRRSAAEAVGRLRASGDIHLLHADLVPTNIILSVAGPRLIDPVGRQGGAEWDLAQLAVTFLGRFGEMCLADLLEGYGEPPTLLPEMFRWMTLRYLQKNRAEDRPEFAERLERLSSMDVTAILASGGSSSPR